MCPCGLTNQNTVVLMCITSELLVATPSFLNAALFAPSSLLTDHCRINSGCTFDTMTSFSDSCDCNLEAPLRLYDKHKSSIKALILCGQTTYHICSVIHHHIRFWYLRCCGCPGLRGRQHLAMPHTRSL